MRQSRAKSLPFEHEQTYLQLEHTRRNRVAEPVTRASCKPHFHIPAWMVRMPPASHFITVERAAYVALYLLVDSYLPFARLLPDACKVVELGTPGRHLFKPELTSLALW